MGAFGALSGNGMFGADPPGGGLAGGMPNPASDSASLLYPCFGEIFKMFLFLY